MAVQYMNEPGIFSMLMSLTPEHQRSRASAATFFVPSASQAIASFAMSVAIVRFGYSYSFAVLAAILFRRLTREESQVSSQLPSSSPCLISPFEGKNP
jgi:hypothetical protein